LFLPARKSSFGFFISFRLVAANPVERAPTSRLPATHTPSKSPSLFSFSPSSAIAFDAYPPHHAATTPGSLFWQAPDTTFDAFCLFPTFHDLKRRPPKKVFTTAWRGKAGNHQRPIGFGEGHPATFEPWQMNKTYDSGCFTKERTFRR
jgi:hypothetical protein